MNRDPFGPWNAQRRRFWLVVFGVMVALDLFLYSQHRFSFLQSLCYTTEDGQPRMLDFFQDWASARNYWEGLPIYSNHRVSLPRYLHAAWQEGDYGPMDRNAHPPTSVLLYLPLARLDYVDALRVWNYFSLVCLGTSLVILIRQLGIVFAPWSVLPLVVVLMYAAPVRSDLYHGQIDMLLLALLTAMWAADRSGKPILAGVLLALATAFKLYPGFFFLYFLLRGRYTVVAVGTVALSTVLLATTLILGREAMQTYLEQLRSGQLGQFADYWENASLIGLWKKLFQPRAYQAEPLWSAPLCALALTVLGHAVICSVWAWHIRERRPADGRSLVRLDLAFAVTLPTMLLLSPITWAQYFLLLLPALAIWWIHLPASKGWRMAFSLLVIGWSLEAGSLQRLLLPDLRPEPGGGAGPWHTLTILSLPLYLLLAWWAVGLSLLRRSRCDQDLPAFSETAPPSRV